MQKSIPTKTQGKTTQTAQSSKMPTKYVKPGLLAASEGLGLYRPRKAVKTKSKEQGILSQDVTLAKLAKSFTSQVANGAGAYLRFL